MPNKYNEKLLYWGNDIEGDTLAQAARAASLDIVEGHIALMPDAHWGMGSTIGSVIPTKGAIIPAAVGVDIGCGMIAVETSIKIEDLPDDLRPLLSRIEEAVPAGVGRGHERGYNALAGDKWYSKHPNHSVKEFDLGGRATTQFGSLGSGNHFVEICEDPDGNVWIVLHSGSRGVGNKLAQRHIKIAKGVMKQYFDIKLPDPALAYFTEGTDEFNAYMTDLMWAQEYALGNRETMMDAVLGCVRNVMGDYRWKELRRINCHHNYTAQEEHDGKMLWITRKGAIKADVGDWGVIPGSMGTSSFIVKGLGNPLSFNSSAHGAGRRMSRTQAKKDFTPESLTEAMAGKTWLEDRPQALLDEHPGSYKDIHQVMEDQADLVRIDVELTQVLNYKGA